MIGLLRVWPRAVGRRNRRSQLVAEEPIRRDDDVGRTKPLGQQVAQAGPDRGADEQRARKDGDGGGHAGDNGEVGSPVVAEVAEQQARHSGRSRASPAGSVAAKRRARSRLWVTTTRMVRWIRVQFEQQVRHRLRSPRDRGCPWARRTARVAGGRRARARSPRAVSRRRTARPGDGAAGGRGRPASRSSSARLRDAAPAPSATSVGMSTFSSTLHCGRRWWSWKTNPTWRLRKAARLRSSSAYGSTPSSRTVPALGGSRAPRMCSSVLLPLPDGPTIETLSPASSRRSMPDSTTDGAGRPRVVLRDAGDFKHDGAPPSQPPVLPRARPAIGRRRAPGHASAAAL